MFTAREPTPLVTRLALAFLVLLPATALARVGPEFDAYWDAPEVAPRDVPADRVPPGRPSAYDSRRGVPTFLWATDAAPLAPESQRRTPESAARWYAEQYAAWYGVSARTAHAARVGPTLDTGRGGIVVTFVQSFGGVDVFGVRQSVLLDRARRLVAISGSLHPGTPQAEFVGQDEDAIAVALRDLLGGAARIPTLVSDGTDPGGYTRYVLAPRSDAPFHLEAPVRVKRVWFRLPGALVPARQIELQLTAEGGVDDAAELVIGDADRRVLLRRTLRARDSYRVWADEAGDNRPRAPHQDVWPHPTGLPDLTSAAPVPQSLIDRLAFNTGPLGLSDPWLSSPVTAFGNNAEAFADWAAPEGFTEGFDFAATGEDSVFDHAYDFGGSLYDSNEQGMAGVTQAFYVVNWLHDWYYDSGFVEAQGVAQGDNFGRGGAAGDRMSVRTLFYGLMGSADMTTPTDGAPPRLRTSYDGGVRATLETGAGLQDVPGIAEFGPQTYHVSGALVAAIDGTPPTGDGCETLVNDVAGKIVLVNRGACSYEAKGRAAEAAGAIGIIVANHTPGAGAPGMVTVGGPEPGIPEMSVSYEFGQTLLAALAQGPQTVTLDRKPDRPYIDMAQETGLVAHEWGHYLHGRLQKYAPGYSSIALGEGWGDFIALHNELNEGDNLDGTYAGPGVILANYYSVDPAYFGLRRYPYTTDLAKNPLTFGLIRASATLPGTAPSNPNPEPMNEVHNAGEVWATMLWECYVSLQRDAEPSGGRSFADARRLMSDYVVAALLMSPQIGAWTDSRDALLAVAEANDPSDADRFALAFARRGAGSCAYGPAPQSSDFEDAVESFVLSPNPGVGGVRVTGTSSSCDGDDNLDAGEAGELAVTIVNGGMAPATDVVVTLSTSDPDVSFPAGTTRTIAALPRLGSAVATFEIALAPTYVPHEVVINVDSASPGACQPSESTSWPLLLGQDIVPNASTVDVLGPASDGWVTDGSPAPFRLERLGDDYYFFVYDPETVSEAVLVTPAFDVGNADLTVSFDHLYVFDSEENGTKTQYRDGGVFEVTTDDGGTWVDVGSLAEVGYDGVLQKGNMNPLEGRPAYGGVSPSFPSTARVTVSLGTALAGHTVRFRFRFGSDATGQADGWFIDRFEIVGTVTPPFPGPVPSVPTAMYIDGDGDGAGDALVEICPLPENGVSEGGDCDDSNGDVHPGAPEVCDGADNDCDGASDEGFDVGVPCEAGIGACAATGVRVCDGGGGVTCGAVLGAPGPETCDGRDEDCDGETDEGFGLGEPCSVGTGECEAVGVTVCEPDGSAGCSVAPGSGTLESCNGLDDDCDGDTDEGFGLGEACTSGAGACARSGTVTCAGGSAACSALAGEPVDEACNGVDDDCDGDTDEGAKDGKKLFVDADGDGFGAGPAVVSCSEVAGAVEKNGDCDDNAKATYPGAAEARGEPVDRDCDGALTPAAPSDGEDATDASDATDSPDGEDAGDATDGSDAPAATDAGADDGSASASSSDGCSASGNASPSWLAPFVGAMLLVMTRRTAGRRRTGH